MSAPHDFQLTRLTTDVVAREFIAWCCNRIGRGFHPDTRFSEYEEWGGRRIFSMEEAERYDGLMDEAFRLLDDPSDEAMRMFPFAIGQSL